MVNVAWRLKTGKLRDMILRQEPYGTGRSELKLKTYDALIGHVQTVNSRVALEEMSPLEVLIARSWCDAVTEKEPTRAGRRVSNTNTRDEAVLKPSVFIGSSSEGLEFARAIRTLLSDAAQITLWNEGFFRPGNTFIDTLVNALPRFDFAALVLTADDLIHSRDVQSFGPRDNVLFELGLFMGRLGRARTFLVHQSGVNLKIPSDLSGVTAAEYEWPRADGNYRSAVGAACDGLRDVIRDLGFAEVKTAQAVSDLSAKQQQQERQLVEQRNAIRSLQFALQGIVTQYELDKLLGLSAQSPFLCFYSNDLYNEVKRLRAMALIANFEGRGLGNIRSEYKDQNRQFDLKDFFYITEYGREYLRLRNELAESE